MPSPARRSRSTSGRRTRRPICRVASTPGSRPNLGWTCNCRPSRGSSSRSRPRPRPATTTSGATPAAAVRPRPRCTARSTSRRRGCRRRLPTTTIRRPPLSIRDGLLCPSRPRPSCSACPDPPYSSYRGSRPWRSRRRRRSAPPPSTAAPSGGGGGPPPPPPGGRPALEARRRLLGAGSIYVGAVFITYFIIGLGLLSFLGWLGRDHLVTRIAAVVALIMAVWMLKDVFLPGWGPSMAAPHATHGWMHRAMERGGLAGMLIAGVLVGICTVPCSGAIYLAIASVLDASGGGVPGLALRALSNLAYIVPLAALPAAA